ncbi:methyltransferase-like protein 25B isoform X2 [Augochlora pura]
MTLLWKRRQMLAHWPNELKAFVEKCKCTDRLPTSGIALLTKLPKEFQLGLNNKKQHEIVHMAHLVHMQCAPLKIKVIVDLGAGLGYVCQLLYRLYGYKVLGLEKNQETVNNAKRRQAKMYPESLEHVKYRCCDLTCNSIVTIETILKNEFQEDSNVCLIGLHACGDLSISASKIFRDMDTARIFIMISCCYHKLSMSEDTDTNTLAKKQYFNNFPLSTCFQSVIDDSNFDIGCFLRQPFLRLACQESAERWTNMTTESHNKHSFYVLARALLQLYAAQNRFSIKKRTQKGTRKSQCLNFETYVKDSLNRYTFQSQKETNLEEEDMQFSTEMHEKNIMKLWEMHCDKLKMVELYTALQLVLQASAESLLLQDRLCWMREQKLEATVISVTNKRLSPRSYAIVSWKN